MCVNVFFDARSQLGCRVGNALLLWRGRHLCCQHEQGCAQELYGELVERIAVVPVENLFREVAQKAEHALRWAHMRAVLRDEVVFRHAAEMYIGKAEAIGADLCVIIGYDLVQLASVVIDQIALLNDIRKRIDIIGAEAAVAQQQLTQRVMPVHRAVMLFAPVVLPVCINQCGKTVVFKDICEGGIRSIHGRFLLSYTDGNKIV